MSSKKILPGPGKLSGISRNEGPVAKCNLRLVEFLHPFPVFRRNFFHKGGLKDIGKRKRRYEKIVQNTRISITYYDYRSWIYAIEWEQIGA